MNRFLLLVAVSVGLVSACASRSELAEANEPHALLQELEQGDIDDSHFRAKLVRIDGAAVVPGNRRSYRIEPGVHTFGFILDVESLHTYQRDLGRAELRPSESAASVREKRVEATLEAGGEYLFGAEIEGYNFADWRPFVVEDED